MNNDILPLFSNRDDFFCLMSHRSKAAISFAAVIESLKSSCNSKIKTDPATKILSGEQIARRDGLTARISSPLQASHHLQSGGAFT
jgi:hypothetical protein